MGNWSDFSYYWEKCPLIISYSFWIFCGNYLTRGNNLLNKLESNTNLNIKTFVTDAYLITGYFVWTFDIFTEHEFIGGSIFSVKKIGSENSWCSTLLVYSGGLSYQGNLWSPLQFRTTQMEQIIVTSLQGHSRKLGSSVCLLLRSYRPFQT